MRPKKDWTNQKFHKLTFIKPSGKKYASGHILWEVRCDCGAIGVVSPGNVISGTTKSCGCWNKAPKTVNEKRGGFTTRKFEPIISSARAVWNWTYKNDGCDFDTFLELSQQNCYYCNRAPHRSYNVGWRKTDGGYSSENQIKNGTFIYNGLDRVDSNLSHTSDNIVPCCFDCNRAKSNLPQNEFLKIVEMIYKNRCQTL